MRSAQMNLHRVTDFLAEEITRMSDRGLGDVQVQSNLAASTQSFTTARAARNLLTKARRELAAGHVERATSYIDRALRLPYNETAEAPTAAFEAHMILFTMVSRALEHSAEGDSTWLDAAEATLTQCGETAGEDLLQTLRALDNDYRLAPSERRRVRTIARGDGHTDGIGDVVHERADDDEATQRVVITGLLLATTAYEVELDRRRTTC
jgi:hypothetical protein